MRNLRKISPPVWMLFIALFAIAAAPPAAAQTNPVLTVRPDTLRFIGNLCGDSVTVELFEPKYFMIANTGYGDMTWTGTANQPWVAFAPTGGGNFDSVAAWIVWDSLPPIFALPATGDTLFLEAVITVSSPQANNSPQFALIQLGLVCQTDEYYLVVQPNYFNLVASPADTLSRSFYVSEAYGRNIEFSFGNSSSWLILPQTFAPVVTPDSVPFMIATGSLPPGVYYDSIVVTTSAKPSNSPQIIPVRLVVSGDNIVLAAEPSFYRFTLQPGETFAAESLFVYELGGRNVNFWTYNQSPWLYVDTMPASPLYTPRVLFMYVSPQYLAPGVYSDTILIMADEAVNSPLLVPVSLIIEGDSTGYAIVASPPYLDLAVTPGTIVNAPLEVYEIHGSSVEFTVQTAAPWLSIAAEPPYITPTWLSVTAPVIDLEPGMYVDTIFIFPIGDSTLVAPTAVPVYLSVYSSGPNLVTAPDYFYFTLNPGDTLTNTGLWVYEASGDSLPFVAATTSGSPWLLLYESFAGWPTTPDSVRFAIFTGGLLPGTYVDTIVIASPDDSSGRYYMAAVPVVLTILGDSTSYGIQTFPTSFDFVLAQGMTYYDSLRIYEAHGRIVGFHHYNNYPWLAVNPLGMPPFLTPITVPIAVNTDSLPYGTYTDTIFIGAAYDDTLGYPMTAVPVSVMVVGDVSYGDANGDAHVNLGDVVLIINYIFREGVAPDPLQTGDADCSGDINVGDAVTIINYFFRDGLPPGCR